MANSLCYHESGHAVVSVLEGIDFAYAIIAKGEGEESAVQFWQPLLSTARKGKALADKLLLAATAGAAAELLSHGKNPLHNFRYGTASKDFKVAMSLGYEFHEILPALVKSAKLLKANWAAVEELAGELEKSSIVLEATVKDIVAKHSPSPAKPARKQAKPANSTISLQIGSRSFTGHQLAMIGAGKSHSMAMTGRGMMCFG